MASVLVCLFTTFFALDKSVHLICEVSRKRFFKIPLCFYKYCLKLSKGRSFPQHAAFAFFGHWAFRLNISNMVASGNFFFLKLSSSLDTDLFESISQSPSMFGTVPSALQGFMLQNSHVWVFVVINT